MKFLTGALSTMMVIGFASAPSLVNAGVAYQGSDSTNYNNTTWVETVCDNESDGYGVHGDFDFNYNGIRQRFDESGGAASACDTRGAGSDGIEGLWRHRTVEERPSVTELDVKGDWHYH
jgi:hypothetical protein